MLPMMLEPNQGQKSATKLLNSCLIRNFYVLYLFSLFFYWLWYAPVSISRLPIKIPRILHRLWGMKQKLIYLLFLHKTSVAFPDDGG